MKKSKKLFLQSFLFILFPVITITAAYSYMIYLRKVNLLNAEIDKNQINAAQQAKDLLVIMDKSADLAEDFSNKEMKETSDKLISQGIAFEEQLKNGNINQLLNSIKIDTTIYEFYLIDRSLKVINSNNKNELGYELGVGNEQIKQQFRNMMATSTFIVDRASYSDLDEQARKFCYQGSGSKNYIYELSIYPERQKKMMDDFFTFLDSNNVKPYFNSLALFYGTNRFISPNSNATVPKSHQQAFLTAIEKNTTTSIVENQTDIELMYTYIYLPMKKGVFVNGWVLQLISSNQLKDNLLNESWYSFLKNVVIFSAILLVLLLFGIRTITNPLNIIIDTINEIKKGNLKKRIHIKSNNELGILANQFNETIDELEMAHTTLETKVVARTTELQTANAILFKQKNENELLLKETHHRVKNNLQIILSIIRLQAANSDKIMTTQSMTDIENRVLTLSSIHDSLYSGNAIDNVSSTLFIEQLVGNIFKSFSNQKNILYNLALDEFLIPSKDITSLGLLINELLTNSFKYAFNGKENGIIHIQLKIKTTHQVYFHYSDDGIGFDQTAMKEESLGLFLIQNFSQQLGGELKKIDTTGTAYEAVFLF
jgi:two-component sensor histidine kinase